MLQIVPTRLSANSRPWGRSAIWRSCSRAIATTSAGRDPADHLHDLVNQRLDRQEAGHRHDEEQRRKEREERVIRERCRPAEALATVDLVARAAENDRPADRNRELRKQDHGWPIVIQCLKPASDPVCRIEQGGTQTSPRLERAFEWWRIGEIPWSHNRLTRSCSVRSAIVRSRARPTAGWRSSSAIVAVNSLILPAPTARTSETCRRGAARGIVSFFAR